MVDNVAGAGGTIGVAKAAAAPPDGYTLVMGADSPVAIAKLVNPAGVRYDPAKDLAPVALINTAPMLLVARPGLPARTLAEVVALARKEPGRVVANALQPGRRPVSMVSSSALTCGSKAKPAAAFGGRSPASTR